MLTRPTALQVEAVDEVERCFVHVDYEVGAGGA